ncbi:hypothetical protein F4561_002629 [Lipingzhangella halophila]|uniref:Uncharacterized protein n=1 Tax=Lipingzhangella halophila TaxID=1783352 RepID=A0A7W7RGZ5_9ACTN|nr:hypothetical protein [Lipingzhangella halophila]MBB4931809.1 hypothetical protein [Lipingzhangella halophila]
MTTRTDTGPTPAKLAGLDPADYSDGCPECTGTAQRAEDYIVLPHRIRPTRTGLVASYRHHCGHTWTCGWMTNLR